MPRSKVKSKAEELARVRNNQRNHRARQKDYLHELEQKLQSYETRQNSQLDDLQKKVELLSIENQLLKYFVESMISMESTIEPNMSPSWNSFGYKSCSQLDLEVIPSPENLTSSTLMTVASPVDIPPADAQAISRLGTIKPISETIDYSRDKNVMASDHFLAEFSPLDDQPSYVSPQLPFSAMDLTQLQNNPEIDVIPNTASTPEVLQLPNSKSSAVFDPYATDPFSSYTISCSEACELLIGYVRLKPDLKALHFKLKGGYRNSLVSGEGCRVEFNKLLTVLSA